MALGLLGGFELRRAGTVVQAPPNSQRLLAFLALRPRPLLRVHVAGTLWPESDDDHAAASLRSALWRLQRSGGDLVGASATHLALASDVEVDVRAMSRVAWQVLGGGEVSAGGAIERLAAAGEVLPDWYDEWLVVPREEFRQLRLHALDTACARLTAAGRFFEAANAGLAAVAAEPLRETAHRALIRVHLAEGNVGEALRQYETYRRLAARHLGARPSRELLALVESARAGVPAHAGAAGSSSGLT